MPLRMHLILLPLLVLALTSAQAAGAAPSREPWRVGLSAGVQSGDYGTETETTAYQAWVTLRRLFAWGNVHLLLPYTRVTSTTDTTRTTESGPGDVRVGGRYYAYESPDFRTALALVGEVKLPTAEAEQRLGTGETDVRIGAEGTRFVTADVYLFADPAYTIVGDPPGEALNDQWQLALGGGGFLSDRVAVSVAYERRSNVFPGTADPEEVVFAISRAGTIGLQGAVNLGLSDGAPDTGLVVGAVARF